MRDNLITITADELEALTEVARLTKQDVWFVTQADARVVEGGLYPADLVLDLLYRVPLSVLFKLTHGGLIDVFNVLNRCVR